MRQTLRKVRVLVRPAKQSALRWVRGRFDRRTWCRDLSEIAPAHRRPVSSVLQFFSANHNIGNYTPVLGIHDMLGQRLDTWNVHKRPIDFDFINDRYRGLIIGGAGLLDPCFEPFWHELFEHCRLPMIIWGVGGCWPHDRPVSRSMRDVASEVGRLCELINVRDTRTADFFGLTSADVSPCPTIAWLRRFREDACPRTVLLAEHQTLVPGVDRRSIERMVRQVAADYLHTLNYQQPDFGLVDLIRYRYLPASRVVTTRLHGAIIANGLGIPYIALACDEKLSVYAREWGGGRLVHAAEEIPAALCAPLDAVDAAGLEAKTRCFGQRARAWVESL